jgi:hypothetical protein
MFFRGSGYLRRRDIRLDVAGDPHQKVREDKHGSRKSKCDGVA